MLNTPIFGQEHHALDPLMVDVTDQVLVGLGLTLTTEELEHWVDFMVGQEQQGNQFSHVAVDAIAACIKSISSCTKVGN